VPCRTGFVRYVIVAIFTLVLNRPGFVTGCERVQLDLRRIAAEFQHVSECQVFLAEIFPGRLNQVGQGQPPRDITGIFRDALGDAAHIEFQILFEVEETVGLIERMQVFAEQILHQPRVGSLPSLSVLM
jgi:hypothetical protein